MDDYTNSVDITWYSTEDMLMRESHDKRLSELVEEEVVYPLRYDRPPSTAGPLERKDVVETKHGFDIYSGNVAVNESERILVSSLHDHLRTEFVPVIVDTYGGEKEVFHHEDLELVMESIEMHQYNEVGINAGGIPGFEADGPVTAYGTSYEVLSEDDVRGTMVVVFDDEDDADTDWFEESGYGVTDGDDYIEEMSKDGRSIKMVGRTDSVSTSY